MSYRRAFPGVQRAVRAAVAAGGGGGNPPPSGDSVVSNPVTTALNATGSGTRYDVTTDAEFDNVPWGSLVAGDVVNVFHKATPYARKWAMRSRGTEANPVIVNGVTDASGNRPAFNFAGASTALGCNPGLIGGNASLNIFNTASAFSLEDFGGLIIRDAASGEGGAGSKPCWIKIRNLELYGTTGNPTYSGLPSTPGGSRPTVAYIDAASGIRVQRGSDIFVENCVMDSPNLDRALRFKSNAVRGGTIENIFMRNVKVGQVAEAVLTIDLLYEEGAKGSFMPTVRNVTMENITSASSPRVFFVVGFPGAVIDNIRIANSTFAGVTATDIIHHAGRITLENFTVEPAKKVRSLNSPTAPAPAPAPAH